MEIILGSARSDERKQYSGGLAGDQRQTSSTDMSGEVSMQPFYLHKKGWNIIRAKDPEEAEKIADNMTRACNNPNIGYSQSDRYGIIKYGTNSQTPCNADCSSLVRQCVKEAISKDPGDFTTANAVNALVNTGKFAEVPFNGEESVFRGDILCTKTKGHIVVVCVAPSRLADHAPTEPKEFGVDVAKWQGVIDWAKVKAAGKTFAVLKVTKKDNSIEDSFERNYTGTKAVEMPIAVYRYVYAKSVGQAHAEAKGILDALKEKHIEGEIWLDMEDSSIRNIGKSALTLIIDTEADILQKAGYRVGVYCNTDWYYNVLDGAGLAQKYKFWIAKYGKNTGNGSWRNRADDPKAIAYAWQYTSKGRVPGINTDVDLDLIY